MTERTKQRVMILLPVLVCFIGIIMISIYWLYEYRQVAFQHISKFSEVIIENNPEVETQVLSAIKKYYTFTEQEINGNTFLAQYGYRSNEFCKGLGWHLLVVSSVLFCVTVCSFLVSARYMDRRNRKRVAELTSYLEQINIGADGTIIQSKEDEFSHLQDEMYKTVTTLYQTRDIAIKAKQTSDRDTQRVECKSAVFHADFFLCFFLGSGISTVSSASS